MCLAGSFRGRIPGTPYVSKKMPRLAVIGRTYNLLHTFSYTDFWARMDLADLDGRFYDLREEY